MPLEEASREQVQVQYLKPTQPQVSHVPGREWQARSHKKVTLENLKFEVQNLSSVIFLMSAVAIFNSHRPSFLIILSSSPVSDEGPVAQRM